MKIKSTLLRKLSCMAAAAVLGAALCVAASAAEGDVAINAQNFPDANFRSYISACFDTDHNGKLSKKEIANVKEIGAWYKAGDNTVYVEIADFTGLQYFTELESLYAAYTDLTSLDVTHNTNLAYLWCSEYGDAGVYSSSLTSLDVSQNTKLKTLTCGGNQLSSLDVSNNTALEYLECQDNQLTSLDVSHNPALQNLRCDGNQLISLDVSQNPILVDLTCECNQITDLDVSHNTALCSLFCEGNLLKNLDVSHNTMLQYVCCDKDVKVTHPTGKAVKNSYVFNEGSITYTSYVY